MSLRSLPPIILFDPLIHEDVPGRAPYRLRQQKHLDGKHFIHDQYRVRLSTPQRPIDPIVLTVFRQVLFPHHASSLEDRMR